MSTLLLILSFTILNNSWAMRWLSLIATLLISCTIFAQTNKFTIHGNLQNTKSKKVFLYIADIITGTSRVDSVVLNNGSFIFRGDTEIPLKAILFSVPDNNRLDFFLEPGKMEVYSKDSLLNATVKAGLLNADFPALKKITDVIDTDLRIYNRTMQAAWRLHLKKREILNCRDNGI